MAKGMLICSREKRNLEISNFFEAVSERIAPDNASVNMPYIYYSKGLATYIYNPTPAVKYNNNSFWLGVPENSDINMLQPESKRPDGTYALFRTNNDFAEILSDYTASRTIWYFHSKEFFIAATSQRMILMFLGDFMPNIKTCNWVLSTGGLGPGFSWDQRLKPITPNTKILLNRNTWDLSITCEADSRYIPVKGSKEQYRIALQKAICSTIDSLDLKFSEWTLALSGGMDSRSILFCLKNKRDLNSLTWGLQESAERKESDATIARILAEKCKIKHTYAPTDANVVQFSTVLNRFLVSGEGRIDHLPGYMDGLKIWADLSYAKRNIIRGYDALGGSRPVMNEFQARRASRLLVTTDYLDSVIPKEFCLTEADIPEPFRKLDAENLAQWRDRLWLQYRTPFITASLDDIKVSYVEIVNPLLFRRVVKIIQSLPDHLRTRKALVLDMVNEMFPGIPLATRDSIQDTDEIIGGEDAKTYIQNILADNGTLKIFPRDFTSRLQNDFTKRSSILTNLRRPKRIPISRRIMKHLPDLAQNTIWWVVVRKQPMDVYRLALRCAIIIEMHKMIVEDVRKGSIALKQDMDKKNDVIVTS